MNLNGEMLSSKPIDIETSHARIVQQALQQHLPQCTRAYAFGSRATWQTRHNSDLDLAILGDDDAIDTTISALQTTLSESELPYKVDIININSIAHDFKQAIRAELVPILWDWQEVRLGDIADINSGKTNSQDAVNNGQYPLFDRSKVIKKSDKYLINGNAVIIAGEGKNFIPRYYEGKFDLHQRCYAVHNFSNFVDSKFMYYYLTYKESYFSSVAAGSTVMSLRLDHFQNCLILLPPLSVQQSIVEVLSSLDDKIDLLHHQNQTLEDMAQALFRRWFVEEANPDWDEVTLDDIAHYLNGLACQKHPPKNNTDKLPVLKIRELKSGISNNSDWATSHVDKKYIVTRGDVIFSWSASLVVKIWDGETCVLNQHLFKITSEKYPKWFYYLWTKYHVQKFISIANSKSTTMGHIKREDLTSSDALVPPDDELKRMTTHMSPLFDKMITNQEHIQWLAQTRDRLLPNLINGKIRLNTA